MQVQGLNVFGSVGVLQNSGRRDMVKVTGRTALCHDCLSAFAHDIGADPSGATLRNPPSLTPPHSCAHTHLTQSDLP